MSDPRQLRSGLSASDFELEMHAGPECAARDNTVHKLLSPGGPFMVRLVHIEGSCNTPPRLGTLLPTRSNVEGDYFGASTLRQIGRRCNRRI